MMRPVRAQISCTLERITPYPTPISEGNLLALAGYHQKLGWT